MLKLVNRAFICHKLCISSQIDCWEKNSPNICVVNVEVVKSIPQFWTRNIWCYLDLCASNMVLQNQHVIGGWQQDRYAVSINQSRDGFYDDTSPKLCLTLFVLGCILRTNMAAFPQGYFIWIPHTPCWVFHLNSTHPLWKVYLRYFTGSVISKGMGSLRNSIKDHTLLYYTYSAKVYIV